MAAEFLVEIRNKIATYTGEEVYVCGNSDYTVRFDFDAEWDAFETKTARFIKKDGTPFDQVFTGNVCPVPVISNTYGIYVGVFAGDLHTTTKAYIPAKQSVLCGGGLPADPSPDVYAQIMEKINEKIDKYQGTENAGYILGIGDDGYVKALPAAAGGGTGFEPDETLILKDGILSVNTADVVEQDNTLPVTSGAVYAEVGNINALLETI